MKKQKLDFHIESYNNLKERLRINKISRKLILNKNILDFGCNNGNYSISLIKMGAKKVDAFEFKKKPKNFPSQIKYFNKILHLKKFNNTYDFIFCNGVLSHKKNWKNIIIFLTKLLKKESYLWLSLYPKSKYWSDVDKISLKFKKRNKDKFANLLRLRDWEEGKINFLQDVLFSKRIYFTKKSINNFLKLNGYYKINFLNRGLSTDLSEKVYKNKKLKRYFSDGEIRLIAKKK